MAELKTKKTKSSVEGFLNKIDDQKKREDCFEILNIMKEVTKHEPKMWGPAIIGFGDLLLKYESGRELDWFPIGFSPRKKSITLYSCSYFTKYTSHLKKLGKHKLGESCLYINKLEDINLSVLKDLIKKSYQDVLKTA